MATAGVLSRGARHNWRSSLAFYELESNQTLVILPVASVLTGASKNVQA